MNSSFEQEIQEPQRCILYPNEQGVQEPQRCFFGTVYNGYRCRCSWEKEMENEVPEGYYRSDEGIFKLYNTSHHRTNNGTVYSYGCQRSLQESLQRPTFAVNQDTNRVYPKGGWTDRMVTYLQNARVTRNPEVRPSISCLGVFEEPIMTGIVC
jgi:hypothetical protein